MTHQCNAATHIFTHCIAHLVKVYQEVEVHCLPGNHERFLHKTFTADVDLQDQYHEHYERPTPIDKKLADEFEKDYKKK